MSKTFLYFAYGSNMLTKRIHINNPTAVQKYIGKLKDHRLDFITFSKRWQGCAATIVPSKSSETWGVVWEIDMINMSSLDDQEGVHMNIYFPKNVIINTTTEENIECRVYEQCHLPEEYIEPYLLPPERQPSFIYLNTLIRGAKEHHIPISYLKYLESFQHNGYNGEIEVSDEMRTFSSIQQKCCCRRSASLKDEQPHQRSGRVDNSMAQLQVEDGNIENMEFVIKRQDKAEGILRNLLKGKK